MVNQKSFNFTKNNLDALEAPKDKCYETYCDTTETGLKLYVTKAGRKTFFIRKFIDYRDERIIIGPYPDLTISQAREKARILKGNIAWGNNPAEEKRKNRKDTTISEFFEYYMTNYSKIHKKPHSIRSEIALFKHHIKDFIGYKKMNMVKKNDIERFLFSYKNKKSNALINRIISLLSGMYNRAIDWGYTEANPVRGIKKEKELSRERFIRPEELPNFFKALEEEANIQLKNFILLSLYIGQRKSNMLAMR